MVYMSTRWAELVFKTTVALVIFATLLLYTLDETPTINILSPFASHSSNILSPDAFRSRPAKTLEYTWTITKGVRSPDGVEKSVYLINDHFPGPLIEARSGDRLKIHVVNELEDEGTAIHWHGLRMLEANAMDGAVGLTQSAIPPSKTMVYDYTLDSEQCGTFWYHAHSELQRADGLYGGLIIHCEEESATKDEVASKADEEQLLMIGDWYHQNAQQTLEWYRRPAAAPNEPVPDSLLINGAGSFKCSMAVPARPVLCSPNEMPTLSLSTGRKTLLRIVNVGSMSGITLSLPGAKLRTTRIDGGTRIKVTSANSVGILYPGERVDILVEWEDCAASHSSLDIVMDDENFRYRNPALTAEQALPVSLEQSSQCSTMPDSPHSSDIQDHFDLQSASSVSRLPMASTIADATFVLYATTMQLAHLENRPVGFMNHTSWKAQSTPLSRLPRSEWNDDQLIPWTGPLVNSAGEHCWVDIIVNNIDDGGHPFHLHGHDFYVLKTYQANRNWGSWNPFETAVEDAPGGAFDYESPRKKDTVFVPRHGYAVLRLRAENPGIWMFHCHIMWHQATGMAMGFQVGGNEYGMG